MLPAQVSYWTLQETKRHNVVTEVETQRHNLVTEDLGFQNLEETKRHNRESEAIGWFSAKEGQRHNLATENLSSSSLAETVRHNKTTEGYSYSALAETSRHNVASEGLQGEYNLIQRDNVQYQYELGQRRNELTHEANETNKFNAVTGFSNSLDRQRQTDILQQNADINQQNADVNQQNADINQQNAIRGFTDSYHKAFKDRYDIYTKVIPQIAK